MKHVVALVPARGGSETIPRKNLQEISGTTLLERAIMSAQYPGINKVYVSTDDPEIAARVPKDRAEVINRPPELATNETPMSDVVAHAIDVIDDRADYLVLLQPTSPFRTAQHVIGAINYFSRVKKARSLISVTPVDTPPEKLMVLTEKHHLYPYTRHDDLVQNRQVFAGRYRQNGAIYIVSIADFREHQCFCIDPCAPYFMERTESLDIDDQFDLDIARFISERAQEELR